MIGAALLAPGAVAQQRDPQPADSRQQQQPTPPATRAPAPAQEPSALERLGQELLRRGAEAARAEQERRDREAAAQGGTAPGAGRTPPPTAAQPPDRTTRPPAATPPTRTPPPSGPTGGGTPPAGPSATGPATIPAAQTGAATRPPRRFGLPDWGAAVRDQRRRPGERAFLEGGGRLDLNAVDRTRLPILTPVDPTLVGEARFYSFGDYYSLNLDRPGLTVELTGTRVVGPTPQGLARLSATGPERVSVQRTIDGQLLSFTRYNLLYTVEVRCDSPRDARCRTDALVREIYGKTQGVILGKAARAEAGPEARP